MSKYPPEAYRVPGEVFGCVRAGELRINLLPGLGIAGAEQRDVPADAVPIHLRLPNTKLWVQFNESFEVIEIQSRDE
jgi:hypothetical protein